MITTGIIYKAVSPSGKVYIGQTVKTLSKRVVRHHYYAFRKGYKEYDYKFARAIRKYGDDLEWSILHKNIQAHKLSKLEIKEIKKYDSFNNGYNGTEGGDGTIGRIHSEETKRKISKSLMGNIRSKETKKKLSKAHRGKKLSKEHKKKIGEAGKGRKVSKETRKKLSKIFSGGNGKGGKLNINVAQKIRKEYAIGKYTGTELAKKYKVCKATIGKIINNLSWKIKTN
ncbi:hypothetical protein LCGC14_1874130 [marine sediment metagenome]|uniref:GIY-YIG domain-containing protein n=1 Tax=marine sediment metagenome TaxID=412755 RepID=A0A0F9J2U9_9ZZZZ